MSRPLSHGLRALRLAAVAAAFAAAGAAAQQFGGPVAISGDMVLVGEGSQSTLSGLVYVFTEEGGAWTESGQLSLVDGIGAPDGFGRSIAADGEMVLVGAPLENEGAGAAYLYRRSGDGWGEPMRIALPMSEGRVQAGSAVALADGIAVAAAIGDRDGAGSVWVFSLTETGASEAQRLPMPEEVAGAFGRAVAVGNGRILVSSVGEDGGPGTVVVYAQEGGQWTVEGTLAAVHPTRQQLSPDLARASYGATLAIGDGVAFVGAPGAQPGPGAVYVFMPDAETGEWSWAEQLNPPVGGRGTTFGSSLHFDGHELLVGAAGGAEGRGIVYRFVPDENRILSMVEVVSGPELEGRPQFGRSLAVAGDLAVAGATGVEGGAGAAVILARGADGSWEAEGTLMNEARGFPAVTGGELECADGDVAGFQCSEVAVVSFLPIKDIGGGRGTFVNDIWGWTDPETGREYAIVGRTDGSSFVDISDPYNPRYLGDLPMTEGSSSSIWRDMKVYEDRVYIVADAAGEHGVQVFDLRQLRDVGGEPVTFEETYVYDGIHSAHNIVINEESGFAYAVGSSGGGETCGGGLHMMSLEDPDRPTFAGCFADPATGRSLTGYTHDGQCVVYRGPDADYAGKEVCFGSNETALNISDVEDKSAPVTIATVSYPNVAYAHQGWLSEDHRYFFMNDEGDEPQGLVEGTRTLVWDVTDLEDPILAREYIAETATTDHNLYVRGDRMYQSNYGSGLRILDVSDPENPVEIGFLDTTPYGGGGSWSNYPYFESGMIVVTSMGDGLFVVRSTAEPALVP